MLAVAYDHPWVLKSLTAVKYKNHPKKTKISKQADTNQEPCNITTAISVNFGKKKNKGGSPASEI